MAVYIDSLEKIKKRLKIDNNGEAQAFMTETCAKAMDKYVPFDTGTLAETVVVEGQTTNNVTTNTITYSQKYAEYVYKGISKSGKPLNYTKNPHSYAGSYWDKRMISVEMGKVVKDVQKFIGGK